MDQRKSQVRKDIKGNGSGDAVWTENAENVQIVVYMHASFGCSINVYT